jgi:hypothetical protein
MVTLFVSVAIARISSENSPALNENLKLLEPLANKKWVGKLKALNEDRYLDIVRQFDIIWNGTAIKISSFCRELNSDREGYIYWDSDENQIALFSINNKGTIQKGYVSEDQGKILFSGFIIFPDRKLEFKNYFELTSEGRLIDKWFRRENGEWLPGHNLELTAEN